MVSENKPAPANVPEDKSPPLTVNLCPGHTWVWDGIDYVKSSFTQKQYTSAGKLNLSLPTKL